MAQRLKGKVALVTGASRGLGRATALRFGQEGAAVAVNFVQRQDDAQSVVQTIEEAGGQAIAVQADMGSRDEVVALVEATLAKFDRIDILVNNAGIVRPASILSLTDEMLDETLDVNVRGVVYSTQTVAPLMIEQRSGTIVNVSSVAAFGTSYPDTTPYAATKAAVVALTKRCALELGPYGVTVNAICPGFIWTDMMAESVDEKDPASATEPLAKRAMLGRVGAPEDIAAAALFLASDEAAFITAQALSVDGGRTDFLSHSG